MKLPPGASNSLEGILIFGKKLSDCTCIALWIWYKPCFSLCSGDTIVKGDERHIAMVGKLKIVRPAVNYMEHIQLEWSWCDRMCSQIPYEGMVCRQKAIIIVFKGFSPSGALSGRVA